jgi:hypothetical protein
LEDAEEYRKEAEDQDREERGNDESKADKPNGLFAERSRMDIQDGEEAIQDNAEEDGITDDNERIAGMGSPKSRFHIGGKSES